MLQIDKDAAARVIQFLDGAFRQRPLMYLGTEDPEKTRTFLWGLVWGVYLSGYQMGLTSGAWYGVYEEHSYKNGVQETLLEQMRLKGLNAEAMRNELIDIHIDFLKQWLTDISSD